MCDRTRSSAACCLEHFSNFLNVDSISDALSSLRLFARGLARIIRWQRAFLCQYTTGNFQTAFIEHTQQTARLSENVTVLNLTDRISLIESHSGLTLVFLLS
jgi:hypothetical protein